jgi:hypothetical protein
MKRFLFIVISILVLRYSFFAQVEKKITPLTADEIKASQIVPGVTSSDHNEKVMACAISANDNWANAQSLTVNGGTVSGSSCGTFQAGEAYGCNASGDPTVWYKFVASATTMYVEINLLTGGCYFGSAIYAGSSMPTANCGNNGPISCQNPSGGPATHLYQLTNLTVGATYYVQISYPSGGVCGTNATFAIQATTSNPGGTITNKPLINTCNSPGAGCFFNSPPTTAQVTSGCTSYSLSGSGYNANSVWSTVVQFTSSPNWSNFSWQAIISSNCSALSGNVVWFNWALYDCNCNQISCGDINTLTGSGLACQTCYRLMYQMELANCTSFTTIYPYQNVPSSPTPCNVLPIQLLYFTATPNEINNKVSIEWVAATEENIRNYRISRSEDGINFNLLTVEQAKGGPKGENIKYEYDDACCHSSETRYYKLESVENDGSVSFTKVIAVTFKGMKEITKFAPNPVKDNFVITFTDKNSTQETKLQIFDMFGRKVKEENFYTTNGYKEFDIADLNGGIYYINLITATGEDVINYKLVKE